MRSPTPGAYQDTFSSAAPPWVWLAPSAHTALPVGKCGALDNLSEAQGCDRNPIGKRTLKSGTYRKPTSSKQNNRSEPKLRGSCAGHNWWFDLPLFLGKSKPLNAPRGSPGSHKEDQRLFWAPLGRLSATRSCPAGPRDTRPSFCQRAVRVSQELEAPEPPSFPR